MPSDIPFASFRRPILPIRNDQVHSETIHGSNIQNLTIFQQQVFTRFNNLAVVNSDELLSISWIHKLLDAFTACLDDFGVMLSDNKPLLPKPPTNKLLTEYFDLAIKAMDIFNAARDGLERIRLWQKHLEIIVSALDSFSSKQRMISEGQFRRARKALMDLALVMLDEKDAGSVFSKQNQSFGHKGKAGLSSGGHSRSLSWSVSHNWSASKQLQLVVHNLLPPRTNDVVATNGLATLIFTMSFVLVFVMWALVAAVPCQDRGIPTHLMIPRQYSWSVPFFLLQSRIIDESKKRDRRNSCGLLKEIYKIEKNVHHMTDLIDSVAQFPVSEEMKNEVKDSVYELSLVCEVCKSGLDPLERKLRVTFRKVMNCRAYGIELLGKGVEP